METIAVYFSPLASTKVAALIGLGMAYHMALVYTDRTGQSFGASSGPSNVRTAQSPGYAFSAIINMTTEMPSAFGTLVSDPKNNHSFVLGLPEDYYTQDALGEAYPHVVAVQGGDLSAQWRSILHTYTAVGSLRLTYSPLTQNSNSMAGTALRQAGIPIPFSSATKFSPALFTNLLRPAD